MGEPAPLKWSAPFPVLHPSITSTKNLRGDKILLPQSALEQLLNAARSTAPAQFSSQNRFYPSSSLSDTESAQQLPNPLIFRLANPKNNNAVYAGIREFSAPEGTLGLSAFLSEALGLEDEDFMAPDSFLPTEETVEGDNMEVDSVQITVQARQLPKGTYVRLRPLEAGYDPDDWKPLLERQLRDSFTTLSKGAMLVVRGVQGEEFKLLVDKVAPEGDAICVVDTDLEVDIEALDEEQARETMRRIMAKNEGSGEGSSVGGEIDIWKSVQGQVLPGEYVDYVLPSWNRSQPLTIELTGVEDEDALDLFVSPKSAQHRTLPREIVHVFGDFSPVKNGTKTVSISPTNVELEGSEAILVSIHGYTHPDSDSTSPIQYTLRAKAAIPDKVTNEEQGVEDEPHSPDDAQCGNCLQWVPKRTMVLHENFCRRNNIVCPHCKSVFKKGSPEWDSHWHCDKDDAHGNSSFSLMKHDSVFHTHRQCPSCEFSANSIPDLARHQTGVCPGKIILCRFCHLEVPQEGDPFNPSPVVLSGMTAHELADGSRTTECHLCDKIVRLRDMETHLKHHELDKVLKAKPPVCRNANCGRTLYGVGSRGQVKLAPASDGNGGNDIGLCPMCFGPLYASMHDPERKALRRRIERRYLGQMMSGCGKAHCGNEWCKTGRSNTGLDAKPSGAAGVLPLVKPLVVNSLDLSEAVYFCVDEASQTNRKLAEMLASEGVWEVEWAIAAAEWEKGNLDRMRDWLQAWAPNKVERR